MICPHLFGGAICPLVCLFECGPVHGNDERCPADFGPWGAWRAFVAPYSQAWGLLEDTSDRLAADMAYVFLVVYASEEWPASGYGYEFEEDDEP